MIALIANELDRLATATAELEKRADALEPLVQAALQTHPPFWVAALVVGIIIIMAYALGFYVGKRCAARSWKACQAPKPM